MREAAGEVEAAALQAEVVRLRAVVAAAERGREATAAAHLRVERSRSPARSL